MSEGELVKRLRDEIGHLRAEVDRLTKERDEALNELDAVYSALGTADAEGAQEACVTIDDIMSERDALRARAQSAEVALAEMRKGVQAAINTFDPWRGVVPLLDALRSLVENGGDNGDGNA